MKKMYLTSAVFSVFLSLSTAFSQDQLMRDFEPIKNELTNWDPVRGPWLAESMLAISRKQPIPDRTFPEDFTPSEMLRMVPESNRQVINNRVEANRTNQQGSLNGDVWNQMHQFMGRSNCKPVSGRTYGDPHLSSFDGKSFSFQTVGEFVLVQSNSRNVQVQTRQKASGADFSFNIAVAMNVAGDRVGLYADEMPDQENGTPIRVDGIPVFTKDRTYYLAHGGSIRNSGKEYVITWPTGEKVIAQLSRSGSMDFFNVTVQIYPCSEGGYEGLLGNANGNPRDDIDTRNNSYGMYESANRFNTVFGGQTAGMSNEAEKEYLNYLAKEFGSAWRVTRMNSLFDYGMGQSTEYFTDFTFPRFHRSIRDLNQAQRDNARRDCERNGITGDELDGCIFDRAYVDLPPTPRPVFRDPTEGVVLSSIQRGNNVRNVNPPSSTPNNVVKKPVIIGGEQKTPVEKPAVEPGISRPVQSGSTIGNIKPNVIEQPAVEKPAVEPIENGKESGKTPIERKPIERKPVEEKPELREPVLEKPVKKPVLEAPKSPVQKPEVKAPVQVSKPKAPVVVPTPKPATPAPVKVTKTR